MGGVESNDHARKPANLSLDSRLLQEAKALGINISRSAEAGIMDAVRRNKRERWLLENAAALESSNSYVEANGLPLSRYLWRLEIIRTQARDHREFRLTLSETIHTTRLGLFETERRLAETSANS